MTHTALITGASSGIGLELAKIFAARGYNLVLVARNAPVLERLAAEWSREHSITAFVFPADLAKPDSPAKLFQYTEAQGIQVDVLVNNAGFGLFGPFAAGDWPAERDIIQVNVTALTELCKLFLPGMLRRKSGKLLNVASTAAFQPGPLMAVYYASKAFVLSFTEALDEEIQGSGVRASVLCPGPTLSAFQERAGMAKSALFKRKAMILDSATVAARAFKGLMAGKRVIIPGFFNNLAVQSLRLSPRWAVTKVVKRMQAAGE